MGPTALLARVTTWPTFAFAVALASAVAFAASPFEGKWKVQDTKGNPFEITLSEDGSAKGSRSGEGLSGTWKAEGDSAVITWESGWTTKITKQGAMGGGRPTIAPAIQLGLLARSTTAR